MPNSNENRRGREASYEHQESKKVWSGVVRGVFMAVSLVQFYLDGLQSEKPRHRQGQNNPENGKEPEDGQS